MSRIKGGQGYWEEGLWIAILCQVVREGHVEKEKRDMRTGKQEAGGWGVSQTWVHRELYFISKVLSLVLGSGFVTLLSVLFGLPDIFHHNCFVNCFIFNFPSLLA